MDSAIFRLNHPATDPTQLGSRGSNGKKGTLIPIGIISLVYFLTQTYVYYFPSYDSSTFLVGAAIPFIVSISLPIAAHRKVLLLASLGFYWSLVEDGPVYLDSIFTWPEVTRFNPAAEHILLEVVYHVLTAIFFALALREARKGVTLEGRKFLVATFFAFCAYLFAYAQNIPLSGIQWIVESNWFVLDLTEHILSAISFFIAFKVIVGLKGNRVMPLKE